MIGSSGKAIIANTEYCMHKAGEPVNENMRDMIVFQIVPSKKSFNIDWFDKLITKGLDRKKIL